MKKAEQFQISGIEIGGVVVITFLIVMGILLKFSYCHECINCLLERHSQTIITVHTSITLIPITILAIIGSFFNKRYLGIGYVEFALQLKPTIFKQKRVYTALIIILFINIWCLLANQNILVVCLLMVSFVVVFVSVYMLLATIIHEQELNKEILDKILKIIKSKNEKQTSFVKYRLINYLKSDDSQLREYKNDLEKILNELSECRKQYNNDLMDCYIEDIVDTILNIDEEFGLQLVVKYYINVNKNDVIDVLLDNNSKVIDAIKRIDLSKKQNINTIKELSEYIIFLMNNLKDDGNDDGKIIFSNNVAYYGYLIGHQLSLSESVIETKHWRWITDSILNNESNYLYLSLASGFFFALIRSKQLDMVEELLFNDIDKLYVPCQNYYLLHISAHCYLIYLAYYEKKQLVSEEDKKQYKRFLESESIKHAVKYIKSEICDHLDANNFTYLDEMKNYSFATLHLFREKYTNGIMHTYYPETVVEHYMLFFVALNISNDFEEQLEYLISNEATYYFQTYNQEWNKYKEKYLKYFNIFDCKNPEDRIKILHKYIERIYVKESLERNHSTINKDKFIKSISTDVKQEMENSFKPICKVNNSKYFEIQLLALETLWNRIENYKEGIVDLAMESFSNYLIGYLVSRGKLIEYTYGKESVEDVQRVLEQMNNKYVLGSEMLLKDPYLKDDAYVNGSEIELLGKDVGVNAVILDGSKIRIKINEIKTKNIFDVEKMHFNEDGDGECEYSFAGNESVKIDKEELEEFLKEEQVILEIKARVSIETSNEKIGVLINYNNDGDDEN